MQRVLHWDCQWADRWVVRMAQMLEYLWVDLLVLPSAVMLAYRWDTLKVGQTASRWAA